MDGSQAKRGTHGLRKRCPVCKKLRKFHEPPGDQGGTPHPHRKSWHKVGDRWVCGYCQPRVLIKDESTQITVILAMDDVDDARILTEKGWPQDSVTRVFHGSDVTLHKPPSIKTMIDNFNRQKEQGLDAFGRPMLVRSQTEPWPQSLPTGALPIYDRNPDVIGAMNDPDPKDE